MSKAWVSREFTDDNGKKKREKTPPGGLAGVGPDDSFVVFYLDPTGKLRQERIQIKGKPGKRLADRRAEQLTAELQLGTFEAKNRQTWEQFRKEYDGKVLSGMEPGTRAAMELSLGIFERIIKPKKMKSITNMTVSNFISLRRLEPGNRGKEHLSAATVNRDLRHLRAALRVAHKWDYLAKVPEFPFLKESEKIPTFASPEDFAKIYQACDQAKYPELPNIPPADWWRGVLIVAMMTGWRIQQILSLRWEFVDLAEGCIFTKAKNTKGRRDTRIELHELAIEHLRKLQGTFEEVVFPWPMNRRTIWTHFQRIQKAAGTKPPAWMGIDHYGFHDLRRAFGTLNAERMTADALQRMMQHRSYTTTQRYINMAKQMKSAVDNLFVPDLTTPDKNAEKTG